MSKRKSLRNAKTEAWKDRSLPKHVSEGVLRKPLDRYKVGISVTTAKFATLTAREWPGRSYWV